jgi:hypothetical protein
MEITAKLNGNRNIIKVENHCTGTFLLLNKDEAIKLNTDLKNLLEKME